MRARILETHICAKQGYALPNLMLDQIAYRMALLLEAQGYRTLPLPATFVSYAMPDVDAGEVRT